MGNPSAYVWGIVIFGLIGTEITIWLEQAAQARAKKPMRLTRDGYEPPNI